MANKTPMQELIEWISEQKFKNTHISDKREIINKAKSLLEKENQVISNTAFEIIKRGIKAGIDQRRHLEEEQQKQQHKKM